MAKIFQIGSQSFEFPDQGQSAPWGEDLTAWAEAVTEALASVQGPEDILQTTATLANGSSGNVAGFNFNTANVQSVDAEFILRRTYSDATPTETENGFISGNYDGTNFTISIRSTENQSGDTGVDLDITNTGQVTYVSEDRTNTDTLEITFKAKAITV